MSYELAGLSGVRERKARKAGLRSKRMKTLPDPRTPINASVRWRDPRAGTLLSRSPLPMPARFDFIKRKATAADVSRLAPRMPISTIEASNLSGLGFSLKPPKFIRKLTLKKVLKPLAITAAVVTGAALIPGALPLLAKGAGLLGKGVGLAAKGTIGAGKLAWKGGSVIAKAGGKGFASMFAKKAVQAVAGAATPTASQPVDVTEADTSSAPMTTRDTGGSVTYNVDAPVPYSPPTYAPQSQESGAPQTYDTPGYQAQAEAPQQAGMGSALVPIALGLAGLVVLSSTLNRGRRR